MGILKEISLCNKDMGEVFRHRLELHGVPHFIKFKKSIYLYVTEMKDGSYVYIDSPGVEISEKGEILFHFTD